MKLTLTTANEEETIATGRALGHLLQAGDVVALVGELGAGKTRLAQGIAQGLDISDAVTSPTFILVAEYRNPAGMPFYHADCYRLAAPEAEALDIGLDELLDDEGVCVVEWAERIESLLPPDHLRVEIMAAGHHRRLLRFRANGARAGRVLSRLQETLLSQPTP